MSERVFVKVVGFTDVERHALNTMFRLSDERATSYALWTPDMQAAPQMSLVDGQSAEARLALESPNAEPDVKLIWVGAIAPAHADRTFVRPIAWPDVVRAMDELFSAPVTVDFGLDFEPGVPSTQLPPDLIKRTLIAGPDAMERFYLRAKLASLELVQADEAATIAELDAALAAGHYQVILVDLDFPDVNGWDLLRRLTSLKPAVPVIALTATPTIGARLRAWLLGARGCLGKPPHPGKLQELLLRI
ncbi:MAG: response regulator [Burkholderiales bacterium]|nr:MAG: response regulator [Burkholderiales bacterium]